MENKDLVWEDITIQWPNKDYTFLDTSKAINNLEELKNIFHCETIRYRIIDNALPVKILFFKNTGELQSINCELDIFYPRYVQKVKLVINGQKYEFTEEDGIWL